MAEARPESRRAGGCERREHCPGGAERAAALLPDVATLCMILEVPRQAWIQAVDVSDEVDIEEALAAQLLQERAKGGIPPGQDFVSLRCRRSFI